MSFRSDLTVGAYSRLRLLLTRVSSATKAPNGSFRGKLLGLRPEECCIPRLDVFRPFASVVFISSNGIVSFCGRNFPTLPGIAFFPEMPDHWGKITVKNK